jgi:hypothetical protein
MHSPKFGNWSSVLATLDTGSDENWISSAIVKRLGLETMRGLLGAYLPFDGSEVSSYETVKPTWSSEGRGISHVTTFRVVPNVPFDVLFGRSFLFSPEVNPFSREENRGPVLMSVPRPPKVRETASLSLKANAL